MRSTSFSPTLAAGIDGHHDLPRALRKAHPLADTLGVRGGLASSGHGNESLTERGLGRLCGKAMPCS